MLRRLRRLGARKTSVGADNSDSEGDSEGDSDFDDDDEGWEDSSGEGKASDESSSSSSEDDGDGGEMVSGRDAAANAAHNAVRVAHGAKEAAARAASAAREAAIRPGPLRAAIALLRADPNLQLGDRGYNEARAAHPDLYAVDKHGRPLPVALDLTRASLADYDLEDLAAEMSSGAARDRVTELWLSNGIGTRGDENNAVTDAGAVALGAMLASNKGLLTLGLVAQTIGDRGARALAQALRYNSTLQTLYLGHNCIHCGGAEALAAALRENHGLRTLTLDHNSVSRAGVGAFCIALQMNRTLTALDLTQHRGHGAAVVEAELARLLALPIEQRTATRAELLAVEARRAAQATDFETALLDAHPTVRALVPKLRADPDGQGNAYTTAVVLPLQCTGDDVGYLQKATDGATAHPVKRRVAAAVAAAPGTGGGATIHAANYYNHLRDSDVYCLCAALAANRYCSTLNLQGNALGDASARTLAELLAADRCALTALDLSRNRVTDKGAKALATALHANRSLRSLNLSENLIGDSGADALAQAVMQQQGGGGATVVAAATSEGKGRKQGLCELLLWGNGISSDRGAKPVTFALQGRALPQLPFVPHPEVLPPALVLKRNAAAVHAHEHVLPVKEKPRHSHFSKHVREQQEKDKERHTAYLKRLETFEFEASVHY